jgi:GGDEF domain-containing protein
VRLLLGKALRSEEFRPVSTVLFSLDRSGGLLQANGPDKFRRLVEELHRLAGNNIRHTDRLSAWNDAGDQLVLICDGSDLRRARRVAERLRRKIEGHDFPFIEGNVACSFGIAELHKGESAESVVAGMKSALEQAVSQGGNRVFGFSNYF